LAVTDFAARYPELVDRLVVVDASYSFATKLGGTRLLGLLVVLSRAWARHLPYTAVRRVFHFIYRNWTDEERDTMAQALVEACQRRGRGLSSRLGRRDWMTVLRQIETPTLILTSDKGMIKPEERDIVVAALPNGYGAHIPGAAHNIQRDNYEGFTQALEEFTGAPT
jgi:pimeloyl-ACP methyl ester carboxylesterase